MSDFLKEIMSQPKALSDTYKYIFSQKSLIQELLTALKKRNIAKIIFTGMGSSFFSAYIPYYFLNRSGIYSEMRETGEFLFYAFPNTKSDYFKDIAIVLISQSGESGEIVQLLRKIKNLTAPPLTIGITNSPHSTLANSVDFLFLTKAGDEKSVTSKTYTATLLLLYILSQSLAKETINEAIKLEIEFLIKELQKFLENEEKIDIFYKNLLSFYGSNIESLQILARGPSLASAYQAALNYKEIVKGYSEAIPCSTFNHGCIECLNEDSKLIIMSSDQENFKLNIHLIKNMTTKWDFGRILHISNFEVDQDRDYLMLTRSPKFIQFKHDISNPFLSPIMEIVILQLFFYKLAEKKNIVPGQFKFTQKITKEV